MTAPTGGPAPRPHAAAGDPQTSGGDAASVTAATPPRCPTRTRLYRGAELVEEGFPAEQISDRLDAEAAHVVWLDLLDPSEADLQIIIEEFGLHPLAVEDALHPRQRPKVDRYRTHLFVNVYAVFVDDDAAVIGELSLFVTERALITVRKHDFDTDSLLERWDLNADVFATPNQVSALTYGLLDAVVDGHYDAIEELDDAADRLETQLFRSRTDADVRRGAYELGANVADLRRVVVPTQEVVARLMRADSRLMDDEIAPYWQDVHDHTQRASEAIDAVRDRLDRIADTQRNEQDAHLNEIAKKLASWGAIIAVPAAVTGFFGQNVLYPGFGHYSGLWASLALIVVLAGGIYALLRRNDWL